MFTAYLLNKKLFIIILKENSHLNLFDNNTDSRLQINNKFRVRLLCVSNQYGFVVAAFKNGLEKIYLLKINKYNLN